MNWRRWIRPGLSLTFLIAVLAVAVLGGSIARDVGSRVEDRLRAEGLAWVTVTSAWRSVTLRGTAPSEVAQTRAVEIARTVGGVRSVVDRSGLLPLRSPYEWQAVRSPGRIELTGHVPSEGARDALLAAARRVFPAEEIVEGLELARGAPVAYAPAVTFALERLAGLEEGQVNLADDTLIVSGTATDAAALDDARAAFAAGVPAGINLGPVEILPARAPRFVWSAALQETSVTLIGFIPNDVARGIVAETVTAAFPGYDLIDQTRVASGEPFGFLDAVEFAVDALTRLDSGGVTLDELTLDLAGSAKSVDDYEAILEKVGAPLPAGMSLVAADVLPAVVSDYFWRADVGDDGIALSGYLPSLEAVSEVVAAAEGLGDDRAVRNEMHVARGAPAIDWTGAVQFAVGTAARLRSGGAAIGGDAGFTLEGVARSSDDYEALDTVLAGTLPASLVLAGATITPPPATAPYRLIIARDGPRLRIAGDVATRSDRADLVAAGSRVYGIADVVDATRFASGAPDGFQEAARLSLTALSGLTGGSVTIEGTEARLDGFVTRDDVGQRQVDVLGDRLPDGYSLDATIVTRQLPQPLPAQPCSDLVQRHLAAGRLEFEANEDLSDESLVVLDRVAETMVRCRPLLVEIGVHSDSRGSQATNRRLTQARAERIVEYLVDAGVRRERLTAQGFGETEPIADNDTEAGRAANRRVAFATAVAEPLGAFPEIPEPEPLGPQTEPQPESPAAPEPPAGDAPGAPAPSEPASPEPVSSEPASPEPAPPPAVDGQEATE